MGYKFVEDLTSDVMFVARGKDLSEVFEQASLALFEVVCQRELVEPLEKRKIKAEGENEKELLHEWLSELLSESDAEEIFFSKFKVEIKKEGGKMVAIGEAWGEPYSQEKSETVVKGITYYKFDLKENENGWEATVVCDI